MGPDRQPGTLAHCIACIASQQYVACCGIRVHFRLDRRTKKFDTELTCSYVLHSSKGAGGKTTPLELEC